MTTITESRTRDILNWLDDQGANITLPYQDMMVMRDAAALIRQQRGSPEGISGELVEIGNLIGDGPIEDREPGVVIRSTAEEIRKSGLLLFRRVRVVPEPGDRLPADSPTED